MEPPENISLNWYCGTPQNPNSPRYHDTPQQAPLVPWMEKRAAEMGWRNPRMLERLEIYGGEYEPSKPTPPIHLLVVTGICAVCGDVVVLRWLDFRDENAKAPCHCHPKFDVLQCIDKDNINVEIAKGAGESSDAAVRATRSLCTEYPDRKRKRGAYRSRTVEFNAYRAIKDRCYPRWKRSFPAFLADVGPRPGEGYWLRSTPGKMLHPGDVSWRPASEPRRPAAVLTNAEGVTRTITEWAALLNVQPQAIRARMRRGMSEADAVAVGNKRTTVKPSDII